MKRLNRFLGSLRKRFQEARRKFSLWEPLLRYRARAAVRSSGAARQDARRLLTKWHVRMQREIVVLRDTCQAVRQKSVSVVARKGQADEVARFALKRKNDCRPPEHETVIHNRRKEIDGLVANLEELARRLRAIPQRPKRPHQDGQAGEAPQGVQT